jgi:hypothetical protein
MADLNVSIGADTAQLEAGLNKATVAVTKFDKAVKQIAPASNSAGFALQNLGRVASDAPFGFIAIGNNIEPLIQSFQSLSKQSGGVGGALKALGSSLIGPGGLLLGFSLVTSAVTVAVQKYGSVGAAFDALFSKTTALDTAFEGAAGAIKKYNENLQSVAKIQQSAAGSAEAEAVRLNALVAVINNTNASYGEQVNALNQLKAADKSRFGDLDIATAKTENLTARVLEYVSSLKLAATVKGFTTALEQTNVTLAEQQQLLQQITPEYGKLTTAADKANKKLNEQAKLGFVIAAPTADISGLSKVEAQYVKTATAVNDLAKKQKLYTTEIEKAVAAQLKLAPTTEAIAGATAKVPKISAPLQKSVDQITTKINVARLLDFFDVDQKVDEEFKKLNPAPIAVEVKPFSPYALIQAQLAIEASQKAFANLQATAIETGGIILEFLTPVIDGVFSAIENGESIFESIGQSLKKLVLQLVATIAKAAILAAIFSVITGGVGGAGLAIGGGVSKGFGSIFGKLLGGATAGGGGGGALFGALGASFGGVSGQSTGMAMQGQVVFRQSGSDLVGVLNRTNGRINRVG